MTPKLGPGRPQACQAKPNRVATARGRNKIGTLRELRVAARTSTRYKDAMNLFFGWMVAQRLSIPHCRDELDTIVCEYVETLCEEK